MCVIVTPCGDMQQKVYPVSPGTGGKFANDEKFTIAQGICQMITCLVLKCIMASTCMFVYLAYAALAIVFTI